MSLFLLPLKFGLSAVTGSALGKNSNISITVPFLQMMNSTVKEYFSSGYHSLPQISYG